MAGFSDFAEVSIRTHFFRTGSYAKPTVLAIALHTADPGDTTAGAAAVEMPNAGGYARVARNPLDANWSAPDGISGLTDNVLAINFPSPTLNWGTATHMSIWDSATYGGGNMLFSGQLPTPRVINAGDPAPSFAAGTLDIVFG